MTEAQIQALLSSQKTFFARGTTLPIPFRLQSLRRLRDAIKQRETDIFRALSQDLGKSGSESYMCEVGLVYSEITYLLRHLPALAKERRVPTPLAQFPSRSYVKPVPYGTVLIMSPWNYPFLLTMDPLVDALAAGNTAILKPSAYSPHTSRVIEELIAQCFQPAHAAVVTGGREENQQLLNQRFDHIFFTGSPAVGRQVMEQAARHLTPVTLELGGKSPCIVDESAKLPLAAKRIVFGKFLNCGQTCVAPDYILCHESVHDQLLAAITQEITAQFGPAPLDNGDYGKIINQKHFDRLAALMDREKVVWGGAVQPEALRIEPTVLDGVAWEDPIMAEEIFGPLLPILTYRDLEEALARINARPHPLALYLFSQDKVRIRAVTARCPFGGGCVNDTVIHLATSHMGFGGVGESGMGAYHGKAGFEAFSHQKSIVDKKTWLDLPMRYQPYRPFSDRLIRKFLK